MFSAYELDVSSGHKVKQMHLSHKNNFALIYPEPAYALYAGDRKAACAR